MPAAKYLSDQRETILQLVSEGATKTAACAQLGIPVATVSSWIMQDEEFGHLWRRARIEQAHSLADECISIAQEEVGDNMAAVQRNRLRIDTRKWYTSKIAPKLYGERVINDHNHRVGVVVLPGLPTTEPAGKIGQGNHLRVQPATPARAFLRAAGDDPDTGKGSPIP